MKLEIGQLAPDFESKNQNGEKITLKEFRGKKVVLYFYPKDNTPGCTEESCNLRDNYNLLLANGYIVLGVSVDDEKSHQKFINKFNLPFPLIADTNQEIVQKYGVWGEKNNFGKTYMGIIRTTFIIDEEGKISEIIAKVNTKEHTSQIIK